MVIISIADPKSKTNPKGLDIDAKLFKVDSTFLIWSLLITGVLIGLYTAFY